MNDNLTAETVREEDLDDLLAATLGDLRQIFLEMKEPEWRFAVRRLRTEDPEQHKRAVRAQAHVLFAIQELELAELQEIAGRLQENAAGLRAARRQLRDAEQDMENIAGVVNAVAGVLKLVNAVLGDVLKLLI
jgi:hypothetical protein